jgi:hypothetical protein
VDVLKPFFEEHIISNQNLFQFSERYESLLEMIPDAGTNEPLIILYAFEKNYELYLGFSLNPEILIHLVCPYVFCYNLNLP